jgi:hypothetical protein
MKRRTPKGRGPTAHEESGEVAKAGGGTRAPEEGRPADDDENPGLPGFRRWREVYVMVFAVFVLVVIALAIFSRVYA